MRRSDLNRTLSPALLSALALSLRSYQAAPRGGSPTSTPTTSGRLRVTIDNASIRSESYPVTSLAQRSGPELALVPSGAARRFTNEHANYVRPVARDD